LFAELFIYLDQHSVVQDWQAVIIYPKRSVEPEDSHPYRALLNSPQVHRIVLDELTIRANRSLGLELLKLIVEPEQTAPQRGRDLLEQVRQRPSEIDTELLIELIETTMVYKFPRMSRQEIAEMLGLVELQETRVYQEGREEGRVAGERSLILKLLTRKIGTLSADVQVQVDALSVEQLEALGEALLDFATAEDLANWLRSHP
jgi:predicted transposase/invertase (TIGR01784 family)